MRSIPHLVPVVASLFLAGASLARAQTPILPGLWESSESYSVLINGAAHDRKCLTAQQITRFIESPSLKHYDCTYASHSLEGGQARFSGGVCSSRKGRKVLSNVSLRGTFAPESFHLSAKFDLSLTAGVALPGTAQIDAHRLSAECPAELSQGR